MRKVLQIVFLIPVLYMLILPFFLSASANSKPCSRISINIIDSSDYHFVTKRQLLNLVYGNGGTIIGKPVKNIEAADIEGRRIKGSRGIYLD
jgi:hypothetical protein